MNLLITKPGVGLLAGRAKNGGILAVFLLNHGVFSEILKIRVSLIAHLEYLV
jgi:hypothetical protein